MTPHPSTNCSTTTCSYILFSPANSPQLQPPGHCICQLLGADKRSISRPQLCVVKPAAMVLRGVAHPAQDGFPNVPITSWDIAGSLGVSSQQGEQAYSPLHWPSCMPLLSRRIYSGTQGIICLGHLVESYTGERRGQSRCYSCSQPACFPEPRCTHS